MNLTLISIIVKTIFAEYRCKEKCLVSKDEGDKVKKHEGDKVNKLSKRIWKTDFSSVSRNKNKVENHLGVECCVYPAGGGIEVGRATRQRFIPGGSARCPKPYLFYTIVDRNGTPFIYLQ